MLETFKDFEFHVIEGEEVVILENEKNGLAKVKVTSSGAIGLVPSTLIDTSKTLSRMQSMRPSVNSVAPLIYTVKAIYGNFF